MENNHVKRREPCSHDNCGSRRFHLGNDGYTYCDQGHQQSDLGATVAEDDGDFITFGRAHRKQKSDVESVISRGKSRIQDLYNSVDKGQGTALHGSQAFEHFLLCLQLVLRKQLHWLVQIQKLPQELESLVRDLWSLRLRGLHDRVPLSYDSDTETEPQFSSQSENESETDAETATARRHQTARRRQRGNPSLIELLSLNYIGILLLRIPVTIKDMACMINKGELLYYRAGRDIPLTMKSRLPGTYRELLEPQDVLVPDTLYQTTLGTLALLHADFGMVVPPLNHPLILYRWIRELALPLEVYVATQRLAREFKVDFCYLTDASRVANLRYPDVRLMVLTVIATKLLFPFDGETCYPVSNSDISALEMDWHAWAAVQAKNAESGAGHIQSKPLSFQEAFTLSETDSLEIVESRLDEYLEWGGNNVSSGETRETGKAKRKAGFRRGLFKRFPGNGEQYHAPENLRQAEVPRNPSAAKLFRVQNALRAKRVVPEMEAEWTARSGSSYRRYRDASELSWPADVFHHKAAAAAGLSLHGLTRAVFSMETRLHLADLDRRQQDRR